MLLVEQKVGEAVNLGPTGRINLLGVNETEQVKMSIEAPAPNAAPITDVDGRLNASHRGHVQVLLVEDDPDYANLVKIAFEACGITEFRVLPIAADAARYLDSYAATPDEPDFVLIDQHLPGECGESLVRWLRAHELLDRLPVIMLSGDASDGCVDRCLGAGANAFMTKPGSFDELLETVEKIVSFWAAPPIRN
ncbi:MAG: response regulator [Planctomycetota bacterium]